MESKGKSEERDTCVVAEVIAEEKGLSLNRLKRTKRREKRAPAAWLVPTSSSTSVFAQLSRS